MRYLLQFVRQRLSPTSAPALLHVMTSSTPLKIFDIIIRFVVISMINLCKFFGIRDESIGNQTMNISPRVAFVQFQVDRKISQTIVNWSKEFPLTLAPA